MAKKGEILLKVLETLGDVVVTSFDLFNAFTSAGYGASQGRISYEMSKIEGKRAVRKTEIESKQRYYNLIAKLKKDGLIKMEAKNNSKFFFLTVKGKQRLDKLKLSLGKQLPPPGDYHKEKGGFLIITFDIPEKERGKRDWLRSVLKNLGLVMVQKSVWTGKVRIPEKLLEDMEKFRIINFVEIFEVTKSGSLKQIS